MTEPNYAAILEKLQPGTKWRLNFFYDGSSPENKVVHIRAIVDDEFVAWRAWSYAKQRWNYQIDHIYLFYLYDKEGHLSRG